VLPISVNKACYYK